MIVYNQLKEYTPKITQSYIYCPHPGQKKVLQYNHDVDVIRFKGRYVAAWNANEEKFEGVPGQYNFISFSDDFLSWSDPRFMFADAYCSNPINEDSQWQPSFINYRDEVLFCAWCTHGEPHTYISHSYDGEHWTNTEVPTAPPELEGCALGFPTNHGLLLDNGRMIFPCSLPYIFKTEEFPDDNFKSVKGHAYTMWVRDTEYSGLLISDDAGKSWHWSKLIKAAAWETFGELSGERGTSFPTTWEPMVFEEDGGRLGLIVRNSTTQDTPERIDKPHQMLLYCYSDDGGESFTEALPVEVDTLCSRSFAVGGDAVQGGLLMIQNDHWCRVPKVMSHDRYHLALFMAPVPDPNLLLPGPVVQPPQGWSCYPNGFVHNGKLYFGASYGGIIGGVVENLPDFKEPFLLPRKSRDFFSCADGVYNFSTRRQSLGLVLNRSATVADEIQLDFRYCAQNYLGEDYPILTIGGKSKQGMILELAYDVQRGSDGLWVKTAEGNRLFVAKVNLGEWFDVSIRIGADEIQISAEENSVILKLNALRKISFGGLYEPPLWENLTERASFMLLDQASIKLSICD